MKMSCPQCGVKGSADDSLLGRRVQCPKCINIFEVQAEIVEAIPVVEQDLKTVDDFVEESIELANEEEVDEVFSNLLDDPESNATETIALEEIDDIVELIEENESEDDIAATLTAFEDDGSGEEDDQEEGLYDDTLTVIEDASDETSVSPDDDWQIEEDEDLVINLNELEDDHEDADSMVAAETPGYEESIDFDESLFDDVQESDEPTPELQDEEELELALQGDEELELVMEDDEEHPPALVEEDEDEDLPDELFGEASEEERDVPEEDTVLLDASFLDNDLDEQLKNADDGEELIYSEKCNACDSYIGPGEEKHEQDSKVYCSKCAPFLEGSNDAEHGFAEDGEHAFPGLTVTEEEAEDVEVLATTGKFTILTLIKDSYHYSKGVKGSIWVAMLVLLLLFVGITAGAIFGWSQTNIYLTHQNELILEAAAKVLLNIISYVLWAGVLMIAVNRVGHQRYSWKMVFLGFKRFWTLLVLLVLQTIMLIVGFLLFILPGIYLSVGYLLAVPLVLGRGYGAWRALETSRKAIHSRWWTVFFSLILMSFLVVVSVIPVGIGLIWTIPMFMVMIGVLYYHLLGSDDEEEGFEQTPLE